MFKIKTKEERRRKKPEPNRSTLFNSKKRGVREEKQEHRSCVLCIEYLLLKLKSNQKKEDKKDNIDYFVSNSSLDRTSKSSSDDFLGLVSSSASSSMELDRLVDFSLSSSSCSLSV